MNAQQKEEEEDRLAIETIRSHAARSLAILEKAFIRNGSGRYFVLRRDVASLNRQLDPDDAR